MNEEGLPVKPSTITDATWNAVVKAMCPRRKDRPQSINEFLTLMGAATYAHVDTTEEVTVLESEGRPILHEPTANADSLQFDVKGVKFKMIKVEGGTFEMKETVSAGFLGLSSEERVQTTTLSDYFIGETQVTQALWQAVMGSNPSKFKGDNLPVERVSWNDCQDFIRKLNSLTGQTFRLPTEAEWEFAARGGNKTHGYKYSGSNILKDVAWYSDNSENKTHDVAAKQPNELGLYDMSGNVWEWCKDWYGEYENGTKKDPQGSLTGYKCVCRGGGWTGGSCSCSLEKRSQDYSHQLYSSLGLRLALNLSE